MGRAQFLSRIAAERERQVELWGAQNNLSLSRLMNIITEEAGESATEINDLLQEVDKWEPTRALTLEQQTVISGFLSRAQTELEQTAACCLKMLEAIQGGHYRLA